MKLRVSHYPQVPCEPYNVEVKTLEEARKAMDVLANYDLFLLGHGHRVDYCNTQYIEIFDEEEQDWIEYDEDDYEEELL